MISVQLQQAYSESGVGGGEVRHQLDMYLVSRVMVAKVWRSTPPLLTYLTLMSEPLPGTLV